MPAPQGILTEAPVVLLTLDYAGHTYRIASEAVSVTDAHGVAHLFAGGLPPVEVGQTISLFSVTEPPTLSLEILLPDADVPLLVSQGHLLTQATAEVSLWRRGDTWEKRWVAIKGRVQDGKPLESGAVAFIVTQDPGEDSATWPLPVLSMNDTTMEQGPGSDYHRNDEGKCYPVVFGYPGILDNVISGGTDDLAATPAYAIDGDSLWDGYGRPPRSGPKIVVSTKAILLCYGWAWPQHLHVWDDTNGLEDNLVADTYWIRDDRGNPLTIMSLDLGDPLEALWALGTVYYVAWPTGSMYEQEGEQFRGAGRILRYALEQTSLPVDWARTDIAALALDSIELGGFWDQPCAPWEWVRDNLLPILPISMVYGPSGVYPVVWRHWATAADATFAFTDGVNAYVEGEIEEEGVDETVSRVEIEYGYNARTKAYMRKATWHAGDIVGRRQSGSAHLAHSALTVYGEDRTLTTQSDLVYRDKSANMIAAWQACAYSHPRKVVHLVSDYRAGHVEAGDVVTITSDKWHLTGAVAHVRRAVWRGSQFLVDAVIFWRPR